jgi:hypothetical protein
MLISPISYSLPLFPLYDTITKPDISIVCIFVQRSELFHFYCTKGFLTQLLTLDARHLTLDA